MDFSLDCSDSLEGGKYNLLERLARCPSGLHRRRKLQSRQATSNVQAERAYYGTGTRSGEINDCQPTQNAKESQQADSRIRRQLNRFGAGLTQRHDSDRYQTNNKIHPNNPQNCDDQHQTQQDLMSRAKVIETAIFIDQALDNKFNGISNGLVELNKLVLTMMNQVQLLFKYSSLQVPITLKLVLIEHLKDSERENEGLQAPDAARGDVDIYLSNFCIWQQMRLENEKRLWWDHAILLSGLDLYKSTSGKNHSGVLGLAWVGGMCKHNYSCTINEATHFESSFVIAHEIGHSLGIMHDGLKNRCDANGFIMSGQTGAGKIHWSRCSNIYLNDSIARGQLRCLDSEQNGQIDSLYDLSKLRSPGQVYTINEQCRLAFGNNYTALVTNEHPYNAVCRELWCQTGTMTRAAHPALEGSSCGDHERFCREGKCTRV